MATDWNVWGTIKQAAGLWFRKDGYALKVTPTGTTLTADRTINLPNANADMTLVTTDGIQTLTNKDIDGGTASNTSRVTLPQASTATLSGLTRKKGTIFYDSTDDKLKYDIGSSIKTVGGGLIPVSLSLSDFTGTPKKYQAESGKLYLVDMDTAAEQYTITAPDGAAEVNFAIQTKNNENPTYLLAVEGFGGVDKFWYNDVEQTSLPFAYAEMRVDFAWDSNDSHFLCAVSQTPVSGTFAGDLVLTGSLTLGAGKGIVGKTDGVDVSSGYVGQVFNLGSVATGNLTNDSAFSANLPNQLPAGTWLIFTTATVSYGVATNFTLRHSNTTSGITSFGLATLSITTAMYTGNGTGSTAMASGSKSAATTISVGGTAWFASGTWNPTISGYAIRIA